MSKKLLQLNNYHYRRGGSDAVFLDQDRLFSELGWRTAVFAMNHPKNLPSRWSSYFVDEIEFGEQYSFPQKLKMAGKVVYSLEAKRKLQSLLADFHPDVAHAHCIYHHLSPSVLTALRNRGIPTVLTAHDLKLACPAYKMLNQGGVCEKCKSGNLFHVIKNRCIHESLSTSTLVAVESATHKLLGMYRRNLDRIIVPSRFYKTKLIEWGWAESQLAYIPNYINSDHYSPHYGHAGYYLYFGRLAPEKGIDTLIKAALQTGITLKIAGEGPYQTFLKNLVSKGGENIEFLGHRSGDDLKELIRNAKAVVLPSQWYENAPISILEAYASGTPVLGASIGGIPEMVDEGVTGFLFQSGNVDSLIDALVEFDAIPNQKLSEMGRCGLDMVTSTFSKSRYVNSLLELYAELGVRNISEEESA